MGMMIMAMLMNLMTTVRMLFVSRCAMSSTHFQPLHFYTESLRVNSGDNCFMLLFHSFSQHLDWLSVTGSLAESEQT